MWIMDEDGKEIWTGDETGHVMVSSRRRLVEKLKNEVRMEIAEEMREEQLKKQRKEQREKRQKEDELRRQKRQAEEDQRQKALLHSGRGMSSIWVPVKYKCCPGCGGGMQNVDIWLGDRYCEVSVQYDCKGKKDTQIHVTSFSRCFKGAVLPGKKILNVGVKRRCEALEDLVDKAALDLLIGEKRVAPTTRKGKRK